MATKEEKLIAEFDGKIKDDDSPWYRGFDLFIHGEHSCHEEQLKYHSSWNWLIPACKKWDKLRFGNTKKENKYIVLSDALDKLVSCYDITPVFKQLVKNIQWYNKNK